MRTPAPGSAGRPRAGRLPALALAAVLPAAWAAGCGHSNAPAADHGVPASRGDAAAEAVPDGAGSGLAARPSSEASVRFAGLGDLRAELLARKQAGRPVLLNFWATWCEPCIEELPDLEDLAREWAKGGPETIGVSLDAWVFSDEREAEARVREMLAKTGVSYANLIYRGEQDPLLDGFHMPGPIPFSVLYDRDGKRIAEYVGPVDVEELRRDVGELTKATGEAPGRVGS